MISASLRYVALKPRAWLQKNSRNRCVMFFKKQRKKKSTNSKHYGKRSSSIKFPSPADSRPPLTQPQPVSLALSPSTSNRVPHTHQHWSVSVPATHPAFSWLLSSSTQFTDWEMPPAYSLPRKPFSSLKTPLIHHIFQGAFPDPLIKFSEFLKNIINTLFWPYFSLPYIILRYALLVGKDVSFSTYL